MQHVKVTEFRAKISRYLVMAQHGETITVMSRGQPVARLVPATVGIGRARDRLIALRKLTRIGDIVSPVASWK